MTNVSILFATIHAKIGRMKKSKVIVAPAPPPPKPALPKMAYSMREAAEMLGLSYLTVHRLVRRGKLRCTGSVRRKLFTPEELHRFLNT
jgi:excisionase family DNA binding protein